MTVSAAFLVLDPPLDRFIALLEHIRPFVNDAVVVIDDRTSTETVSIIESWGVVTVPFRWVDDFSAARNAGLLACNSDWVLTLDPDELPSVAMLNFVQTVDESPWEDVVWHGVMHPAPRGYLFFTKNFYDGVQGPEWEEHWHCRLFRRSEAYWYKPIHEQVSLHGLPESQTRGTELLLKAPRAAMLIHSQTHNYVKDLKYAEMSLAAEVKA